MTPTNEAWFDRAQRVIPGGVNSPVRAFGSVGGAPYFVASAEGARVTDVEGTSYVDLVQSYGAIVAGHAHPKVVEAIRSAALDGTSYGAPTPREVELAEAICERVASVEKVRMVNSGTEATMSAIRVARGATGRSKLLKFAGNYHGHSDGLLVSGGTAMASLGLPASAGVTDGAVADTVVAPYNVVPTLDDTFAAVIVEPCAANMGLVPPAPGFLEGLRAECDRVGALLIFDEVITGFRVARGGAQERTGVTPDLSAFGKIIGGGLPVGAFGGRADVMDALAPLGPVYQAGTLSGNPLATAAGLAVLDLLDDDAYALLDARADRLATDLQAGLDDAGLVARVPRFASLVGLFFGTDLPHDYPSACTTDEARYAAFFHALLRHGVAVAPGAYEVLFPGLAHDDAVLDAVAKAARAAAAEVAALPAAG
ncbi:MAG TPA: glutamate-1-semialdehyde 2,1-aminomutase [Acidimicrobiales bacterium]